MTDLTHDLAAMRAGRDCVSALAEAFGRSSAHRTDQLLEAVGILRRLAEELEILDVGAALVAQARAFADGTRVEEIRAFVKPRDVLRWNELTEPYQLAHVREARRDPGHPLHAIVKWVEAPVEAERDRFRAGLLRLATECFVATAAWVLARETLGLPTDSAQLGHAEHTAADARHSAAYVERDRLRKLCGDAADLLEIDEVGSDGWLLAHQLKEAANGK